MRSQRERPATSTRSSEVNARLWRMGDHVAEYAHRVLLPAEVVIIARYRDALSGRVLEAGCGAGRVLGYLVALGGEVHGIDISQAMVDYCRRRYPEADVRLGDLADPKQSVAGPLDAVIAADNVLDVFDHADRLRVLRELHDLLTAEGLLIFSSHNLAHADGDPTATGPIAAGGRAGRMLSRLAQTTPRRAVRGAALTPRRARNRRRLLPQQSRGAGHAILNDSAADYGALHYYIGRDDQERQLREIGFDLVECLDVEGLPVAPGQAGYGPWLLYVARPAERGSLTA